MLFGNSVRFGLLSTGPLLCLTTDGLHFNVVLLSILTQCIHRRHARRISAHKLQTIVVIKNNDPVYITP